MSTSKKLTAIRTFALSATLALAACNGEQVESQQVEKSPPADCAHLGGNLIEDPGFATVFAPRMQRRWHASEHAAGGSYEPSVDNGVLSIRKIGKEPWFLISQSPDIKQLRGKRLAFSAEIKLDLHEPQHAHSFGYGGGLAVLAKRDGKTVVNSSLEHEPNFGVHDWQPVEVVFQLQKKSTYLRVGFLHQAGGSIQVRNPALQEVDPACPITIEKKSKEAQPDLPSTRDRLRLGQ